MLWVISTRWSAPPKWVGPENLLGQHGQTTAGRPGRTITVIAAFFLRGVLLVATVEGLIN